MFCIFNIFNYLILKSEFKFDEQFLQNSAPCHISNFKSSQNNLFITSNLRNINEKGKIFDL